MSEDISIDWRREISAEEFIKRFKAFRPGFEEANNASKLALRQTAPEFNIFRALKVQRSEKFHSDFIAYLLDPNGSHAQGCLFLQTFFELLKPDYPSLPIASLSHDGWLVQREVFFSDADGSGRMDIVLRNHAFKALYVIENKVDAGEQDDQVSRYAAYLERQVKEKDYSYHEVLFLTLDGHPSLTAKDKPHHPIAYHTHIRAWLEHTLPKIEAATVRETVSQYLSIIQDFKEG